MLVLETRRCPVLPTKPSRRSRRRAHESRSASTRGRPSVSVLWRKTSGAARFPVARCAVVNSAIGGTQVSAPRASHREPPAAAEPHGTSAVAGQVEDGETAVRPANGRDADRIAADRSRKDQRPALRRQLTRAGRGRRTRSTGRAPRANCPHSHRANASARTHQVEVRAPAARRAVEGRGLPVTADDTERLVSVTRREVGRPTGTKAARRSRWTT